MKGVLKQSIAGMHPGDEVDVLATVNGADEVWVDGGDGMFRCPDEAVRSVDSHWLRCRVVEGRVRDAFAERLNTGSTDDPREWIASRAVALGKERGMKVWTDGTTGQAPGVQRLKSAVTSIKTLLGEARHHTRGGESTRANEAWVLDLWELALDEWDASAARKPKPVLQLAPAPAAEVEEWEDDLPEGRPTGGVWDRIEDVRLSVRLMEAWLDCDEDDFLACLYELEGAGR